jgi:hypothetical protein
VAAEVDPDVNESKVPTRTKTDPESPAEAPHGELDRRVFIPLEAFIAISILEPAGFSQSLHYIRRTHSKNQVFECSVSTELYEQIIHARSS